jgi:hypothetical protein
MAGKALDEGLRFAGQSGPETAHPKGDMSRFAAAVIVTERRTSQLVSRSDIPYLVSYVLVPFC